MLSISRSDLTHGVTAWWSHLPWRKTRALCLAWSDHVLLNPAVEWPKDLDLKSQEGWGTKSLKVYWVEHMSRFAFVPMAPVYDTETCLEWQVSDYDATVNLRALKFKNVDHTAVEERGRRIGRASTAALRHMVGEANHLKKSRFRVTRGPLGTLLVLFSVVGRQWRPRSFAAVGK